MKKSLSILLSFMLILTSVFCVNLSSYADDIENAVETVTEKVQDVAENVTEVITDTFPSTNEESENTDELVDESGQYANTDNTTILDSGICGDNVYWTLDSNYTLTISGTGPMYNESSNYKFGYYTYLIKSVVVEYGVTRIGYGAFSSCVKLTSITIPESVITIAQNAFYNCTGLKSVTIPDSVTIIGASAFNNCTELKSVTIGNSVNSIGNYVFRYCANLTNITIPDSATSIGSHAFEGCTGLTSITIPDSVTSIGLLAFSDCTGLTGVYINSIESWCNISFANWSSNPLSYAKNLYLNNELVTDLVIPDAVTSIGRYAFGNFTGLASVTIPDSVTSIGDYAFADCTRITSITIPDSVTSIEGYAFNNVINIVYTGTASGSPWGAKYVNRYAEGYLLYTDSSKQCLLKCNIFATAITIPDSVITIVNNALYNCTELTSVTIGNGVKNIGEQAFYNCTGLTNITIPDSVISIGSSAFENCTGLTNITIPDSVMSIGDCAFLYCTGLAIVAIGNSVTSIGLLAFYRCTGLTIINVDEDNTVYDSRDNCNAIIETSTNELILGCKNTVIPNSVISIGDSAFYNCTGLTSITIPNSVTSIGEVAFEYCSGLTSVTIGNGVKSIGEGAFHYCTELKNVYYIGSKSDWGKISISSYNDYLLGATIEFNHIHNKGSMVKILVNPTCTTDGLYANVVCCLKCGTEFSRETITVDKLGHIESEAVKENNVEPTCTTDGLYDNVVYCSRCGVELSRNSITVDKFGNHNFVLSNGVSKCSRCGKASEVQSSHNYENNMNRNYYYSYDNASSLTVKFSDLCKTEANYDFINIYDGNGNIIGQYSGDELAGKNITIPTNSFRINMTSDSSKNFYGFSIDSIVANANVDVSDGSTLPQSEHNYNNNCNDNYTYSIPGAKSLAVKFSADCKTEYNYDFIYIYDENNDLVGKYSGRQLANETINIEGSSFRVVITSDKSQSYYGYKVDSVIANYEDSTKTISQSKYIESDHNYKDNTSDTKDYTIPNAKLLAVKFSNNTQTEENYDFIYIYDENDDLVGKYSGTELAGKTVVVNGSMVKVTIVSDRSKNYYGYSIDSITPNYNDVVSLDKGTSNVTVKTNLPQSNHNYSNNMNNSYSYEYPNASELKVTFSSSCKTEDNYDFIYIYDGLGNLVGKYSGTQLSGKTITIPTGSFKITMTSDNSKNFYGFSIDSIEAIVSNNTTVRDAKNVSSAIAPVTSHDYRNNADDICYYSNPGAKSYKIKFNSNTKTEYNYDFIYIYNEDTGELIGKYSGRQLASEVITINASKFSIRLTSDRSATYYGYSLDYIETYYNTDEFETNTNAYPESNHKYENYQDATYSYTADNDNVTGLAITFSSKTYTEANYDFIYIYDENNNLIGKYSGSQLASKTVYVPTNNFTIRMTSDRSASYYGFSIDNIVGYTN